MQRKQSKTRRWFHHDVNGPLSPRGVETGAGQQPQPRGAENLVAEKFIRGPGAQKQQVRRQPMRHLFLSHRVLLIQSCGGEEAGMPPE